MARLEKILGKLTGKTLVGLTGNIASGKSEAAKKLEELGAYVINADEVGHEVYDKSFLLKYRLAREFGTSVIKWNLEVDRKKLAKIVFEDPSKMKRLSSITWPHIGKSIGYKILKSKEKIVVVEAALIFEAGWDKFLDYTVCVTCDDKLRKERLMKRSKLSKDEAEKRISAQMDQHEKAKKSDYVLENDQDINYLHSCVQAFWDDLQRRCWKGPSP